ncbi:uncharacterized protein BHQ10_005004 [Talaromyces amestolkiae]|uniref:Uncharacterized protein n=1 Tax=Talaromyces amestolkiae TaxID=1196081 RepID=A0A364KZL5_TALAM|nr:uncharacterized protein BHQ10_005004 [Talaromyces amestolkiae]RAO68992.1 hypothetical protein BHQ10_005004 [Talaromyces amestolkiae]
MTSTHTIPEVHIERTRRTILISKRRYQYDERVRFPSPNRTVSRGTQTLEMSDYPSALNMMYRTLSPAPGSGRKTRSNHHHHRTEETKRNRKHPKSSTVITTTMTTTEIHEADATLTATESITTSPTATKRTPAVLDVGKIVGISQSDGTERLAMISEMTTFHDSRIVIVCAWLYSRADINEDLMDNAGFSSEESHKYLQSMWPIINKDGTLMTSTGRSQCDYMVSTKRTIIVSDAMGSSLNAVSPIVATRVCRDAIYHADSVERRICDVDEGSCYWLKKIL